MKILLDARFYGLENAGIGRYTMNLVQELQKMDKDNNYVIFLKKKYFDELKLPQNWEKVEVNIKHYSLEEQIKLPKIIKKYNPDLTHFLHFNVPLHFKGKFVVTIHDMTMHNQKADSSNLFFLLYQVKHFAYKRVFKHAVTASQKIITPSKFVKNELIKNFNIPESKVEVTYEGI